MSKQNLLSKFKVSKATCPSGMRCTWLSDGNNLLLKVDDKNNKSWVVRLFKGGKEYKRGLGAYPQVKLKDARQFRDEYKRLWEQGTDPTIYKLIAKNTIVSQKDLTFEKAYQAYLNNKVIPNLSDKSIKRTKEFYKKYLQTPLGRLPLADINDQILLTVLEKIHTNAPSSATKVKSLVNLIYIHMKEKRLYKGANPTLELKGNSLIAPPKSTNFDYLKEHRVGEFLLALDTDRLSGLIVRTFIYVVMVTALRTNSLRNAKWSWLDSKTNTLNIPSMHMKSRQSFRCPLPKQAITKLNALKTFLNSKSKDYIFEGNKDSPISDATARLCVQRLADEKVTVHGFRTLFNIVVSKMNKFEIEKIEAQLTHAFTATDIRKVYMGKEDYLEHRRQIVQAYANWCDEQI